MKLTKIFKKDILKILLDYIFNLKDVCFLRLKVLLLIISLLFSVIIAYLTYTVSLGFFKDPTKPKTYSNEKYLTLKYDILDRNGSILAVTIPSRSVYLRPKDIVDKELAVEAIHKAFNINLDIARKMVNNNSPFVWVTRNISTASLNKFLQFGVIGAYVERGYRRFYPYSNYSSHVVGITNIDGIGISGVEYYFNKELLKHSIQLSLDIRIQVILREALIKSLKRNNAKRAFGIIVNPKNGEVLALASVPDFDPNKREELIVKDMFNYVTQGVFEQGSTFKLFTVAMALDSNLFTISDTFDVSKPIVKNKFVLVDNTYIDRSISIPEILMYSSDIGSALIARSLDTNIQKRYFSYMGLFNATTIELPEKGSSVLPKVWSELTHLTLSYGYGMAVSQATAANAFLTLINGGYYTPLTLVKHTTENKLYKYQVFKPETSKLLTKMGRLVIAKGTGKAADVVGYNVGGKTGTAELIDRNSGSYSMEKVLSSVVAYFPAEDPKYLILMSVEEPQRSKNNNWSRVAARTIAPEVKEVISNIGILLGMIKNEDYAYKINTNNLAEILKFIYDT